MPLLVHQVVYILTLQAKSHCVLRTFTPFLRNTITLSANANFCRGTTNCINRFHQEEILKKKGQKRIFPFYLKGLLCTNNISTHASTNMMTCDVIIWVTLFPGLLFLISPPLDFTNSLKVAFESTFKRLFCVRRQLVK